jgi:hypothetical protein
VIARFTLLLLLVSPVNLLGQTESAVENAPADVPEVAEDVGAGSPCERINETDHDNPSAAEQDSGACQKGASLSNYNQDIPTTSNSKTAEADLISSEAVKPAIFPIDVVHDRFAGIYRLKERINDTLDLAFSVDYTLLAQRASFTEGETNSGSSSVFRILGTWLRVGDPEGTSGVLVWKTETRNPI